MLLWGYFFFLDFGFFVFVAIAIANTANLSNKNKAKGILNGVKVKAGSYHPIKAKRSGSTKQLLAKNEAEALSLCSCLRCGIIS